MTPFFIRSKAAIEQSGKYPRLVTHGQRFGVDCLPRGCQASNMPLCQGFIDTAYATGLTCSPDCRLAAGLIFIYLNTAVFKLTSQQATKFKIGQQPKTTSQK